MTSRIKGPNSSDGPRRIEGVDGDQPVDEAKQTERAGGVGGPGGPGGTDAISKVAAQLRAGEIDVDRAVELLIDHTISQQSGRGSHPQMAQKLRQVLQRYVKDDPLLVARIQKLNLRK